MSNLTGKGQSMHCESADGIFTNC